MPVITAFSLIHQLSLDIPSEERVLVRQLGYGPFFIVLKFL